jgi:anaerobic selenocysteine-containing dehydrogenase
VCAHDCPDQCSLLAHVEDGRIVRIEGDPEHPFTAGFACAKVHHDHELVHSPERVRTPLRRVGAKGDGRFSAHDLGRGPRRDRGALAGHHA